MAFTEWFPATVKPGRQGLYQIRYKPEQQDFRYYWFDGEKWRFAEDRGTTAFGNLYEDGNQWRGLTEAAK